jgi:hypothetical protein
MPTRTWLELCKSPSNVISEIEANPRVGFWTLSSIYGIASSFFFAHFYSLGVSHSFALLFFSMVLIGPFLGAFFLNLDAWLLHKTSFLFGGAVPFSRCQAILAGSKVFYLITLAAWLLFFAQDPTAAFLYVSSEGSSLCVALFSFSIYLFSFFLLVQLLKAAQFITFLRALAQVTTLSLLSFSITCISMFVIRFVYICFLSFLI